MLQIKPTVFFGFLLLFFIGTFFLSLTQGASAISLTTIYDIFFQWLLGKEVQNISIADAYVITQLRLPRTILAFLVGAALALTGAVIQTLFRNPLADPSLIGVSGGGALGAATMLVFGSALFFSISSQWMLWLVPASAFIGGLIATLLIMYIGQTRYRMALGTLLLVGIAINALATSGIGLLTYLANELTLRSLTFWMLGSLSQATWGAVAMTSVFVSVAIIASPFYIKPLNALLLGEAEAYHLGVNVERVKRHLLVGCALAVGATVAIAGIITFIGLVVPHIARMLVGANHRYVLPGSILLGGTLLMLADIGARTWVAPAELPIGIITALLGAPFFLTLIVRSK